MPVALPIEINLKFDASQMQGILNQIRTQFANAQPGGATGGQSLVKAIVPDVAATGQAVNALSQSYTGGMRNLVTAGEAVTTQVEKQARRRVGAVKDEASELARVAAQREKEMLRQEEAYARMDSRSRMMGVRFGLLFGASASLGRMTDNAIGGFGAASSIIGIGLSAIPSKTLENIGMGPAVGLLAAMQIGEYAATKYRARRDFDNAILQRQIDLGGRGIGLPSTAFAVAQAAGPQAMTRTERLFEEPLADKLDSLTFGKLFGGKRVNEGLYERAAGLSQYLQEAGLSPEQQAQVGGSILRMTRGRTLDFDKILRPTQGLTGNQNRALMAMRLQALSSGEANEVLMQQGLGAANAVEFSFGRGNISEAFGMQMRDLTQGGRSQLRIMRGQLRAGRRAQEFESSGMMGRLEAGLYGALDPRTESILLESNKQEQLAAETTLGGNTQAAQMAKETARSRMNEAKAAYDKAIGGMGADDQRAFLLTPQGKYLDDKVRQSEAEYRRADLEAAQAGDIEASGRVGIRRRRQVQDDMVRMQIDRARQQFQYNVTGGNFTFEKAMGREQLEQALGAREAQFGVRADDPRMTPTRANELQREQIRSQRDANRQRRELLAEQIFETQRVLASGTLQPQERVEQGRRLRALQQERDSTDAAGLLINLQGVNVDTEAMLLAGRPSGERSSERRQQRELEKRIRRGARRMGIDPGDVDARRDEIIKAINAGGKGQEPADKLIEAANKLITAADALQKGVNGNGGRGGRGQPQ